VFLDAKLEGPAPSADDEALLAAAQALFTVRDAVNLALEPKIKSKEIGHRREVAAHVTMPRATAERIATIAPDLAEVLTVASVDVMHGEGLSATVARTDAAQCQRCWRHLREVGSVAGHSDLCARCASVLSGRRP
jgi:isoleucyl-tRNA synthetase